MALKQPSRCCAMGSYDCCIPMPISGRVQGIDYCVSRLVAALNAAAIETLASCCGHGQSDGSILLADGRELVLKERRNGN